MTLIIQQLLLGSWFEMISKRYTVAGSQIDLQRQAWRMASLRWEEANRTGANGI